jgi:Phytanoyl-CoA dioxygenase (PhyH)
VDQQAVRRARTRPRDLAPLTTEVSDPSRLNRYTAAVADPIARTSDPWVESPWIEQDIVERKLSPEMAAIARHYHSEGFAVIPGLVDPELIIRILDDLIEPLHDVNRIQDAWKFSSAVRELAVMPAVLDVLRMLYGREPVPFQTLNFEYGTQQRAHSDTVHFSSLPRRYMCGVWAALEDVDANNGPLFYYPGSQRLPDPFFQRFGLDVGLGSYPAYEVAQEALLEAHGIKRIEFHAKAGDILIWSANIVHGGKPITEDGRTRWSQVTHYFFDGCVYVTPMHSDPEIGEWFVRADLENILTGQLATQSYNHQPVQFEALGNGRSRIHRGESFGGMQAELEALRQQTQSQADQLEALHRSRALRVGNAVLGPVRWIRKRVRR